MLNKWIIVVIVVLAVFFAGQVVEVSQEEDPPGLTEMQQNPIDDLCCLSGSPCCGSPK
jgi:hypothetical protein